MRELVYATDYRVIRPPEKFIQAMDDDMNTADALSAVFELTRDINGWMSAHLCLWS